MVVRDAGWIEREYNQEKWPELLGMAEDLVAAGEHSMPRLLSLLELHQRNSWHRAKADSALLESAAFSRRVDIPFAAAFEGFADVAPAFRQAGVLPEMSLRAVAWAAASPVYRWYLSAKLLRRACAFSLWSLFRPLLPYPARRFTRWLFAGLTCRWRSELRGGSGSCAES